MKKFISILLVVLMVISLYTVNAFASGSQTPGIFTVKLIDDKTATVTCGSDVFNIGYKNASDGDVLLGESYEKQGVTHILGDLSNGSRYGYVMAYKEVYSGVSIDKHDRSGIEVISSLMLEDGKDTFSSTKGTPFTCSKPIIKLKDNIYLPLRAIFEYLGYSVSWDKNTKTFTVKEILPSLSATSCVELKFDKSGICTTYSSKGIIQKSKYIKDQGSILLDSDLVLSVFETLNPGVFSYESSNNTLKIISLGNDIISTYKAGDKKVVEHGKVKGSDISVILSAAPQSKDNKFYLPVKDLLESYSFKVLYNSNNKVEDSGFSIFVTM